MANDEYFYERVQNLKFFQEPVEHEDGEPSNLKEKLEHAGRIHEYKRARRCNEHFLKLLEKYGLYKSAQELFGYIMANIESSFQRKVMPSIVAGKEAEIVDALIYESVVDAIVSDIPDTELFLNHTHIEGMLYYIGDKCHIQWHAE